MYSSVSRRRFLAATAAGSLACGFASSALSNVCAGDMKSDEKRFRKAVKIGMVGIKGSLLDKFELVKKLGYDGIELDSPGLNRDEAKKARDEAELPIHGVVDSVHWRDTLSHPDPAVREKGVAGLKTALADAKAIGATSVLLVPAVVNKDVSYADAYKRSQTEIKKALPLAEELGIRLLIENVWNNFLLSPLELARYLDELESPLAGSYFDVGNIVRYGWPEQWIRTLGKRIVKLDVKEYSRKKEADEGVWKGFNAELLEGDCDWPAVMKALGETGYSGWGTAEVPGGGKDRLADIAARMDKIFALPTA